MSVYDVPVYVVVVAPFRPNRAGGEQTQSPGRKTGGAVLVLWPKRNILH